MATFVALLHGINLGAKRRIAMPALRESMLALGLTDVATYIQSGNLVFTSRTPSTGELTTMIRETIHLDFDMDVPVILRSGEEMQQIHIFNPFLVGEDDPTRLHVTFLDHAPRDELIARERCGVSP